MNAVPEHNAAAAASEMQRVLNAQRGDFERTLPVSVALRKDRLRRAIALLSDNQDELCAAMDADFGNRPVLMSKFTDIVTSVDALKHAAKHVERWSQKDRRAVRFPLNLLGARAWVQYQPKGVVGLISPWNFPINLTFSPLAGILAAGNRCMIKPSETTPQTSALMEQLVAQYFDEKEIWVVTGGPDVGKAFAALPFDHLLFTGATEIGRHVMRAAAENLTPVTLELGGKSPVILGTDADLTKAARRIMIGKTINAGQICLAPDYVLVDSGRLQETVGALEAAAREFYPQIANNSEYTSIVDERHRARLESYLDQARARDCTVIACGEGDAQRMPVTLVVDPPDDIDLMQEEIFGPILPVKSVPSVDQAIEYIMGRPRPLALYYLGPDHEEREEVLERTISGGVTLDDVAFHTLVDDLPFGGIGASGMGNYHGRAGFETFSHARAIYRQPPAFVAKLMGAIPPYGERLKKLVDFSLRT